MYLISPQNALQRRKLVRLSLPPDLSLSQHTLFWPPRMDATTKEDEQDEGVMFAALSSALPSASLQRGDSNHTRSRDDGRNSKGSKDIPMSSFVAEDEASTMSFESPMMLAAKTSFTQPAQSLADLLGEEVAQKTQVYMVGRQEAETEVVIDRLIHKEGSEDKALLYVVSEMITESKGLSHLSAPTGTPRLLLESSL
ncbi:vanilloid receptor [Elysia marginata]|uniref:Vanilloid receptor n=1 Tax=Elysia marginata TaxID=1093978 RepID=A0AAV4GA39_9GAST|nr:vanilloid receptor [Elysia marginata]